MKLRVSLPYRLGLNTTTRANLSIRQIGLSAFRGGNAMAENLRFKPKRVAKFVVSLLSQEGEESPI